MANVARVKTLLGNFEDHVTKLATAREKLAYYEGTGADPLMEREYGNEVEFEAAAVAVARKALLEEVAR